jgi:hypothetical protein
MPAENVVIYTTPERLTCPSICPLLYGSRCCRTKPLVIKAPLRGVAYCGRR